MVQAEELRQELDCQNLEAEEFRELIDMKCLVYREGYCDKLGRPILFFIIKNFKPKNVEIP